MKSLIFRIIPIILLISCNSAINEEHKVGDAIDDIQNSFNVERQITKIPSDKISEIKGKKGSRIKIDPSKLEHPHGEKISEELEVILIELVNKSDFFKEDLPTISNEGFLESGGMFYLSVSSNDIKLNLKKGEELEAEFPNLESGKMNIYYAELENGKVRNWVNSEFESKIEKEYKEEKIVEKVTKKKSEGDIGKILDFIDSQVTEEEKEVVNTRIRRERKVSRIYRSSKISQLGWINIDRLIKEKKTTPIICKIVNEDINFIKLLIFFKSRNVYLKYGISKGKNQIPDMPIGEELIIIGISAKGEQIFTDKQELKVDENLVMDFSLTQSSEKQLEKLLEGI